MKRIVSLAVFSAFACLHVCADDLTRNAQAALKTQGFFYGDVDGQLTSETSAAVKRFQIRNGLEVTGTLTRQTLESLGLAEAKSPTPSAAPAIRPPAPRPQAPAPDPERPAPEDIRPPQRPIESPLQAPANRIEETPIAPPVAPPPSVARDNVYSEILSHTPFALAPADIQQLTVRKAQSYLRKEGFYRDSLDGFPSPELEEALLSFQRRARLPMSGRLDLETLSVMRLLPGRGGPALQPFNPSQRPGAFERPRSVERPAAPSRKVYRGIWVE